MDSGYTGGLAGKRRKISSSVVQRVCQIRKMLFAIGWSALQRAVEHHAEHKLLKGVAGLGGLKGYILVVKIVIVYELARYVGIGNARSGLVLRVSNKGFQLRIDSNHF